MSERIDPWAYREDERPHRHALRSDYQRFNNEDVCPFRSDWLYALWLAVMERAIKDIAGGCGDVMPAKARHLVTMEARAWVLSSDAERLCEVLGIDYSAFLQAAVQVARSKGVMA